MVALETVAVGRIADVADEGGDDVLVVAAVAVPIAVRPVADPVAGMVVVALAGRRSKRTTRHRTTASASRSMGCSSYRIGVADSCESRA